MKNTSEKYERTQQGNLLLRSWTNQTLQIVAEIYEDEDEDEMLDQSNIVENMNGVGFGWQSLNHSWTKPLLLFPEWFHVIEPSLS